jgi:hypothetical protein
MNVTDMHQNKSLAQPFCIGAASPLVIGRNCANGRIIALSPSVWLWFGSSLLTVSVIMLQSQSALALSAVEVGKIAKSVTVSIDSENSVGSGVVIKKEALNGFQGARKEDNQEGKKGEPYRAYGHYEQTQRRTALLACFLQYPTLIDWSSVAHHLCSNPVLWRFDCSIDSTPSSSGVGSDGFPVHDPYPSTSTISTSVMADDVPRKLSRSGHRSFSDNPCTDTVAALVVSRQSLVCSPASICIQGNLPPLPISFV